jgi:hypothetical protein
MCHECGNEYKDPSQHWALGDCTYPKIRQWAKDALIGMLMGDGYLCQRDKQKSYIQICMTSPSFLEWFDNQMGWLTTGVKLRNTAAEQAEKHRKSGFNSDAIEENYQDNYEIQTRSHPWFENLKNWYTDDGKQFPESLKLNPVKTKFWYISDGGLQWRDYMDVPRMRFAVRSQKDRGRYFERLFEEIGFNASMHNTQVAITTSQTQDLLDWMGEPIPGFEYKWCTTSRKKQKKMAREAYNDV